jgi:hypothetical protein
MVNKDKKKEENTNSNNNKKAKEEALKPKSYVQRLSDGEHFAEAVIVGGVPAFIVRKNDVIYTTDKIEFEDKIIKPLPAIAYLNKPYSFKIGEIENVIEQAKTETLDTLYSKVKSIWKKYVDADDFHISICAADTIFTYYQDRLGLVHYLFFVGGPSSGKSNRLEVFRFLAYRNWTSSDITPANIYQLLGSREEGMATLCEDEADNLDLNFDKMRIYKLGYTTGRYVLRIDNEGGRIQLKFFTFCWKAFAAERLPDSVMARGFLQRIIDLQCTYGFPEYDILEVENPANTTKYTELLQELEETRNLLLMYRIIHFNEKIPDIPLNIINRERQLFKPILRVFQKTETINELFPVISEYINQKRAANANSLHAYVYDRVVDLIKNEGKYELETKTIWEHVIDSNKCPGDLIPHKPLSYLSVDYAEISRKQITEICKDVLGAKSPRRHGSSSKLIFDKKKLKQLKNFYNLSLRVKVKENGEDGEDGEDVRSVGLDKLLTKPNRAKRKSSTKDNLGDPYKYGHLNTSIYVDGSNRAFVNLLKVAFNESLNWEKSITKPSPNNMNIIPVSFNSEHREMLSHLAMLVSKEYLCIPKEFDKLEIALRTAYADEYSLNKDRSSYNDLTDSLRLACKQYKMK